jgi:uncharacterized SAM-binding protein YcdF (DUF218 family)
MLSPREKFICLVSNDSPKKADVIVILEGDGLNRIEKGAELYKAGFAPVVVISGDIDKKPHSIPAAEMKPYLIKAGVPDESIILEEKSMNTREQAIEINRLAVDNKWHSIIMVASHYHQYRAYLTFLKPILDNKQNVRLINCPARNLSWFLNDESAGGKRSDVLENEFEKIEAYRLNGHQPSYEDAIKYLETRE